MSTHPAKGSSLALAFVGAVWASNIPFKLAHPIRSEVVSGTYEVTADISGLPQTAAVEYRTGSLLLAISTKAPFSLSWNTAYVSDGSYSLQATAYDAWGRVLAVDETVVNVRNRDCQVVVNAPDLSKTLNGAISLSVTGRDPRYYPARWNIFVDGTPLGTTWTDNSGLNAVTVRPVLDTAHFVNGKHELHIEIASDYWPKDEKTKVTWHDYRLSLHRMIAINNGHTFMGISANCQHIYLRPRDTARITCRALFTDNKSESCLGVSYSSSNPKVVTVDSLGRLTAGTEEGFAEAKLTSQGRSTTVEVWVKRNSNVPHFSGNGQMLIDYKPGGSLFVVAPFVLQPSDVQDDSNNEAVHRAAVNTLYSGLYPNPRQIAADYDKWKLGYDSSLGASWKWAAAHEYHLYTMGDDIARNIGGEAWWTMNWPFAQRAVQYAMQSLADSGVAIAADIIDEGSMMWGSTPTPPRRIGEPGMFQSVRCHGLRCTVEWPKNPVVPKRFFAGAHFAFTGSRNPNLNTPLSQMFQATEFTDDSFEFIPAGPVEGDFTEMNDPNLEFLWWAGSAGGCPNSPCAPPVPNTALSTIAAWLRSASSHVPISWPALGIAPPVVHNNWAGRDSKISDFMSHYWDSFQAGRTYAWSSGIAERVFWMRNAFYSRQPYVRLDRPQIMLSSISSFYYTKRTPHTAYYHPPEDDLVAPGISAPGAFAEMFTAAAIGNAGVRLYQFEEPRNEENRSRAPLGTNLQTGASPFAHDKDSNEIWKAMGYAATLLTKTLQPFILATRLSSPAAGDNIVTAVRKNEDGVLLLAINGNDWERTVSLDLTPYRTGNEITRYLSGARGIRPALLRDRIKDEVSLLPGEAAIYLFPRVHSTRFLTAVHIPAPALPPGAERAVLHHSIIYSDDLEKEVNGTDCLNGCDVLIDKNLGESFYQFLFVNRDGAVVKRGPVGKLG